MYDVIEEMPRWFFKGISHASFGKQTLRFYDEQVGLSSLAHLDEVDEEIREFELAESDVRGEVLFPIIPGYEGVTFRACILAHAFRTRGYSPTVLRCESKDGSCDLERCLYRSPEWDESYVCDFCRLFSAATAEAFGMEPLATGAVLPNSYTPPTIPDDYRDVTYRGVPVSDFALATTRRSLRKHTVNLDESPDRDRYFEFLKSGMELVDVYHRLFERRNFSAVIVNESPYIHGGIPVAVGSQYDVPGYDQEFGFEEQSITFGRADHQSANPYQIGDRETTEEFLDRELDEDQRRRITEFIAARKSGEGSMIYSAETDLSVQVDDANTVVAAFTNLLWDASLEFGDDEYAFDDTFNWLETTIDEVRSMDDVLLVVKTHPAEAYRGTNESVAEWVERKYDGVPPNVELLPPDTDVNTYELMRDLDVGLVYTSTVGLEMAYDGIPVVVVDRAPYRDLGFTFDPTTKEEYVWMLSNLGELSMTEDMRTRAERYAYLAFIHQNFDFPFVSSDWQSEEFEKCGVTHRELKPGNEAFDTIVNRITSGEPVVPY